MTGQYSIQVWSFPILIGGSPVNHRFLVLVDGNGNTVRELHGGAEGPNGTFKTTALSGTLFTMEGDPNKKAPTGSELPYAENPVASTGSGLASSGAHFEYAVATGTQVEMEQGWAAANAARVAINDKNMNYLPAPTGALYDGNSNGVLNVLVRAATNVTYQNEPGFYGTPGSDAPPLSPAEIDAARIAAGLPPRTGQEDVITVGTYLNETTGLYEPSYTRINGATGEVLLQERYVESPSGDRLDSVYGYENNPATFGNWLKWLTVYDAHHLRPDSETTYNYASDGHLTQTRVLFDEGNALVTGYDAAGRVDTLTAVAASGVTMSETFYDDANRADVVKTFDAAGRLATYTAYDDNAQRDYFYTYDAAGRVDTLTTYDDAGRADVLYSYDDAERLDSTAFYDDNPRLTTIKTFDDSGRLDSYVSYQASGVAEYAYTYDDAGRTDTVTMYDAAGRPDLMSVYDDNTKLESQTVYDDLYRVDNFKTFYGSGIMQTYTEYDEQGLLDYAYKYDASGRVDILAQFDQAGRLLQSTLYDDGGRTDADYHYNASGLLSVIKNYDDTGGLDSFASYSSNGYLNYTYTYDNSGRADVITYYTATGLVDAVYVYDDVNRVDQLYEYDSFGKLLSLTAYDDSNRRDSYTQFDSAGHIDYRYMYDDAGRVDSLGVFNDAGLLTSYTGYNDNNQVITTTLPAGYDGDFDAPPIWTPTWYFDDDFWW